MPSIRQGRTKETSNADVSKRLEYHSDDDVDESDSLVVYGNTTCRNHVYDPCSGNCISESVGISTLQLQRAQSQGAERYVSY